MEITERLERLKARLVALSQITDDEGQLTRTFCSGASKRACEAILLWANQSGLQGWVDNAGNLRLISQWHHPQQKTFYMGSHLDTVVNAGQYDGTLGFLMALDQLERVQQLGKHLPYNLEVVGFSDEEGVRYHCTYLGSSALAGTFDEQLLERVDDNGVAMKTAIEQFGGNPMAISNCKLAKEAFGGYLEIHIEQGPVLQHKNLPVGIVDSIAGQARISATMQGQAGHAGTVPMGMRHDAACGAAELALAAEQYAMSTSGKVVATTGKWVVSPNASNVIPNEAKLSLDIRSSSPESLAQACTAIEALGNAIAKKRQLQLTWQQEQYNLPVAMDSNLQELLDKAIGHHGMEAVYMGSGAGHDAVCMSNLGPVAMLFIRCKDGISHNPKEYTSPEDIEAAMTVCDTFFEYIAELNTLKQI